jgi:hypothetical protein
LLVTLLQTGKPIANTNVGGATVQEAGAVKVTEAMPQAVALLSIETVFTKPSEVSPASV